DVRRQHDVAAHLVANLRLVVGQPAPARRIAVARKLLPQLLLLTVDRHRGLFALQLLANLALRFFVARSRRDLGRYRLGLRFGLGYLGHGFGRRRLLRDFRLDYHRFRLDNYRRRGRWLWLGRDDGGRRL